MRQNQRMKKFNLSLEFQGLCLFDPKVLDNFINENKINDSDLLTYFINHPELGQKVIEEGIVVPIYSIAELDYSIVCYKNEEPSEILEDWKLFSVDSFGLKIESGIVIIADIYTIMSWDDPDFFIRYEENYRNKSDSNDYFKLSNGFYQLNIKGFRDNAEKSPFDLEYGYEFIFNKVENLNIHSSYHFCSH